MVPGVGHSPPLSGSDITVKHLGEQVAGVVLHQSAGLGISSISPRAQQLHYQPLCLCSIADMCSACKTYRAQSQICCCRLRPSG